MTITHTKVSAEADDPDYEVSSDEWNASHTIGWTALYYETTTGAWIDYTPSASATHGRFVFCYNSTLGEYRLYVYMNSGWRAVELS